MKIYLSAVTISAVFLAGCSNKVSVTALEPAQIDRAALTKKIAVMPFTNDTIGLSSKIEADIASKKVDKVSYFTVISRTDIDKIISEQKLQHSGLADESTAVELGMLLGAQAMITGNVSSASSSSSNYRQERVKCADSKCKESYVYSVPCTKKIFTLSAQIKMVDVKKGDIIYADSLDRSSSWSHCKDQSGGIPSERGELESLSREISEDFVYKLTPNYKSFDVVLLDDPEIDYSDEQEEMLEYALIYIERGRYKKAEELLSKLLNSTKDKCYVAAYDLGVVKEIQAQYERASQLYSLADSLTKEPEETIDMAVLRIDKLLSNQQSAHSQINR
jgi:curli biogenesis system outer membrane secretion channel CsgG